jgi:hypothetical protein
MVRPPSSTLLHLSDRAPWAAVAVDAIHRLEPVAGARLIPPPAVPTSRAIRARGTPHP